MDRKHLSSAAALVACLFTASVTAQTLGPQPPPQPQSSMQSPAALIELLAAAYSAMDLDLYASVFAHSQRQGIEFRFVLDRPDSDGRTQWGYDEEMRIHRRMFLPETIPPGDKPLPRELWVQSIDCELTQLHPFVERWDLYRSEQNPLGELDRHRWRATDSVYATSVLWRLRAGGQFAIEGKARFVVVEDLQAAADDPARFLVYRWEDLGECGSPVTQASP